MLMPFSLPPTQRRRLSRLVIGLLVVAGVVGAFWRPPITRAALPFAGPDPVTAAWEKARTAGSYHFTGDVVQKSIPVATITNVGRASR